MWTRPEPLGYHQEGPSAPFLDARPGIISAHGALERPFCGLFDKPVADQGLALGPGNDPRGRPPGAGRFRDPDGQDPATSI